MLSQWANLGPPQHSTVQCTYTHATRKPPAGVFWFQQGEVMNEKPVAMQRFISEQSLVR